MATLTFGINTERLWGIVKNTILEENPPYIQEHGDSDESILYLAFSRYINEHIGYI